MKKYKWNNPYEWIIEKVSEWDENQLRHEIVEILSHIDIDTIQDIYQSDMEKDGYFNKIKKEK